LKNTWHTVREPASEFEEAAQKTAMWQGMERLDRKEKEEIEAIDRALAKMDEGHYGRCEKCRRDIEIKRLKVLPSTNLCKRCAKQQEMHGREIPVKDDVLNDEDLPVAYDDMDDEALPSTIFDKVENDGRIGTEDLEISCEDGVVYLNGSVTNEFEHHLLTDLLEERMALHDVVDNLKIEGKRLDEDEDQDEEEELLRGA
jgi:RNA polymerase-binding transcription factor DksA